MNILNILLYSNVIVSFISKENYTHEGLYGSPRKRIIKKKRIEVAQDVYYERSILTIIHIYILKFIIRPYMTRQKFIMTT